MPPQQQLVTPLPSVSTIDSRKTSQKASLGHASYRDAIHIRKDIISALMEYGQLNQSRLISHCNLNYAKHIGIIDQLVEKAIIARSERKWGNSNVIEYAATDKGVQFMLRVMQPYENMFPR